MSRKYQSEALMVSHQSAEGLYKLGIIDEFEMEEIDEMCLAEEESEKRPVKQHRRFTESAVKPLPLGREI